MRRCVRLLLVGLLVSMPDSCPGGDAPVPETVNGEDANAALQMLMDAWQEHQPDSPAYEVSFLRRSFNMPFAVERLAKGDMEWHSAEHWTCNFEPVEITQEMIDMCADG